MQQKMTVAITGDSIINRRASVIDDGRFLSLVDVIRKADVGYTHLETIIHDYDGPEVYPAAEAGYTWMRSPRFVSEELKWLGFDIVSVASNHCLDYSYGGIFETRKALDEAGVPCAGIGRHLGEAREAAYLDTAQGRVGLVSMCSSFTGWARAGETRPDVKGRPGLNPLRFEHAVDGDTLEDLKRIAVKLGWWYTGVGEGQWLFNPAGLHNAIYKFVESDQQGVRTLANEEDVQGNLRAIKNARRQADLVMVHIHTHEWNSGKGLHWPAEFVVDFARACVDAGADVFIGEGSHAPLRGIEIYKNKPIFYDPGDFISMNKSVTRLPADYFSRISYGLKVPAWEATVADGWDARVGLPKATNPPGGYFSARVIGGVIAVCSFDSGNFTGLELHPFTPIHEPRVLSGLPVKAEGDLGRDIIEYIGELSAEFGTTIEYREGVGVVKLGGR